MPGKPEIKLVGYACETSEWDNKGLKENEEEKLVKLKERWTRWKDEHGYYWLTMYFVLDETGCTFCVMARLGF